MKKIIRFKLLLIFVNFFCLLTVFYAQKAELVVSTGHSESVGSAVFSPDGRIIASGSYDGTIKLWEAASAEELTTLKGHKQSVNSLAFSPDGKMLASGSADKTIKIWELESGKLLKNFAVESVNSVAFSPDGKNLAFGDSRTVKIWNIESDKELKILYADYYALVNNVAFNPDGKTLASGSDNGTIKLWNLESGRETVAFKAHSTNIRSLAYSPDGTLLASGSGDDNVKLWDARTGKELKSFRHIDSKTPLMFGSPVISSVSFSPDGRILASAGIGDFTVKLWDVTTGQKITTLKADTVASFSPDGKTLVSGGSTHSVKIWDTQTGNELKTLAEKTETVDSIALSRDGRTLASGGFDVIKLWNLKSGEQLRTLAGHAFEINAMAFSPDGKILASAAEDHIIKLWNVETGSNLKTLTGHTDSIHSITFSPDGKMLASAGWDKTVRLWDVESGGELKVLKGHDSQIYSVAFSPDGRMLASGGFDQIIKLWDVETGRELKTVKNTDSLSPVNPGTSSVDAVMFSADGKTLISEGGNEIIKLWDIETGKLLKSLSKDNFNADGEVAAVFPDFYQVINNEAITSDGTVQIKAGENNRINIFEPKTGKLLMSLITLGKTDWIVTTPEGRFDTNKSLDRIEGLHWIVNDEILKPLPLDVFMRQYYEPDLLRRVLAGEQFKPLPSIAEINRVQPKITIKEIKTVANSVDLADIIIEIESVADDISISATDRTKRKQFTSGVYDLRLFRDGQLVDVSAPADAVEHYDEFSAGLPYDEETKIWREANDLKNLKDVKFDADGKAFYTFHNVKLPHGGAKQVEFSAYAFNADRVKSETDRKTYNLPTNISSAAKKGRAYLVTIGVNASDNPNYNLQYAANDARKMQETVGARLKAEIGDKYSDVVQIPLISDAQKGKEANDARKEIIRGVFSLLAGHRGEVSKDALERIGKIAEIPPVEPEDTLIIAFSGHGYADANGIFYMLPADIPKEMKSLSGDALKAMISSDELSLWMRNVTAREMMIVVDACHSAAAVQGAGFKPGPMGSRGLGQLAYDKGMKILAATQSDNVALELKNLQQGLLSYVLVKEGIEDGKADVEVNKQITSTEWLGYAVREVPQIYQDILAGRRGVLIDGNAFAAGQKGSLPVVLAGEDENRRGVNLQQPTLFDFRQNKKPEIIFNLPSTGGV